MELDRHMRQDLDNYITGHYGEDQFRGEKWKPQRRVNGVYKCLYFGKTRNSLRSIQKGEAWE